MICAVCHKEITRAPDRVCLLCRALIPIEERKGEVMTPEQINRRFAELAGLIPYTSPSGVERNDYPDFCADPRLVLEVMMKREDYQDFMYECFKGFDTLINQFTELILDKTGKLVLSAIAYLL